MIKYNLILLVGIIVHMGSAVYGQKESENTYACIFIPNNISVSCDHYNKDFTLDVLLTAPFVIKNMKVLDRWGTVLYSTDQGPWTWYGGLESAGVYNVTVSYIQAENQSEPELKSITQAVYLIK
jgi:hypothetical protein